MSDEQKKSLAGAYGMAFLALITGVIGFPRYYLKQRLRGTLMSALFLGGLLMLTIHYIGAYIAVTAVMVDTLAGLGGGQADFTEIPSLNAALVAPGTMTYIGGGCCTAGLLWWFVDLFLLPSAVKKYNEQVARRKAGVA